MNCEYFVLKCGCNHKYCANSRFTTGHCIHLILLLTDKNCSYFHSIFVLFSGLNGTDARPTPGRNYVEGGGILLSSMWTDPVNVRAKIKKSLKFLQARPNLSENSKRTLQAQSSMSIHQIESNSFLTQHGRGGL